MKTTIEPRIGEGVYIIKDVSFILRLDYQKTYRWILGYWGDQRNSLDEQIDYTFGADGNKAINFYSLIEFYTFFRLRESGISASKIRQIHEELSVRYNTPYPFAKVRDFSIENRRSKDGFTIKKFVYYFDDNLIRLDGRSQLIFKGFIDKFLTKIEFDDENLAARFFPLPESRNVVVDPNHQFGQPIITGTNIKTSTIYNLFAAGERVEFIAELYDLSSNQVIDAINFYKDAA